MRGRGAHEVRPAPAGCGKACTGWPGISRCWHHHAVHHAVNYATGALCAVLFCILCMDVAAAPAGWALTDGHRPSMVVRHDWACTGQCMSPTLTRSLQ
jgi:hypothetical protein